jgi:lauroyl/myristoyl acyltransferase
MTTAQPHPDMDRTLEALERFPAVPRMPSVPFALRVKTSPLLWRLLPRRALIARAIRKARQIWESSPSERGQARAAMARIVTGTPQAGALEKLAREYITERQVHNVLFWRPWKAPRLGEQSSARVRKAVDGERGVVLSVSHTGPFHLIPGVFARGDRGLYAVSGPWYFEPPSHDYWGRRLARWRKGAQGRRVLSTRSFPILKALLERGQNVLIYFDLPGPRETRFLGKRVMLADGSARLACEADAIVLPLRIRRAGETVWLDVAAPLDPRGFADVGELHVALAALHERWILEFPAAMDDPSEFGWGQGARPDAWVRPNRVTA